MFSYCLVVRGKNEYCSCHGISDHGFVSMQLVQIWSNAFNCVVKYSIDNLIFTRCRGKRCNKSSDTTADFLRRFPAQFLLTLGYDGLQVWTGVQVLRGHASKQFPQLRTNLLSRLTIVFSSIQQGHPKGKEVGLQERENTLLKYSIINL